MKKNWRCLLILVVVIILLYSVYYCLYIKSNKSDYIGTAGSGIDDDFLKKEVGSFFGIE